MINVIIVDDQLLLLDLLEQMFQSASDIKIVARASDGNEAAEMARKHKPDVVLMDIKMPECNGIEATKIIKEENSHIKILLLTASEDRDDVIEALQNRADGYILKNVSKEELLLAIKGVYYNMKIIQHDLSAITLCNENKPGGEGLQNNSVIVNGIEVKLSEREISIIRMIVDGKSAPEMASNLFLTEGRIRNIITEILSKLMLKDRTQLAVFALRNKII